MAQLRPWLRLLLRAWRATRGAHGTAGALILVDEIPLLKQLVLFLKEFHQKFAYRDRFSRMKVQKLDNPAEYWLREQVSAVSKVVDSTGQLFGGSPGLRETSHIFASPNVGHLAAGLRGWLIGDLLLTSYSAVCPQFS